MARHGDLEEVPVGYTGVARLPYSDLIVIASCDRFFLYDGERFTYASGDLTWFFDDGCIVREFTPVGRDRAGSVQLSRWKLTGSGRLEPSDGVFAGDVDWDTWLRSEPNPAQWPGAEGYPNGRPMKSWDEPDWWKLPRFGFAMRYGGGQFVRLGPDLAPLRPPGRGRTRTGCFTGSPCATASTCSSTRATATPSRSTRASGWYGSQRTARRARFPALPRARSA